MKVTVSFVENDLLFRLFSVDTQIIILLIV
jgi:hypothetical protein